MSESSFQSFCYSCGLIIPSGKLVSCFFWEKTAGSISCSRSVDFFLEGGIEQRDLLFTCLATERVSNLFILEGGRERVGVISHPSDKRYGDWRYGRKK